MATSDKRARAYDHLNELVESAPDAAAPALLTAIVNYLSADDFIDMVEREFEWEDPEEEDSGADCPDCDNARIPGEGDGVRCESCTSGTCNDLDETTDDDAWDAEET